MGLGWGGLGRWGGLRGGEPPGPWLGDKSVVVKEVQKRLWLLRLQKEIPPPRGQEKARTGGRGFCLGLPSLGPAGRTPGAGAGAWAPQGRPGGLGKWTQRDE